MKKGVIKSYLILFRKMILFNLKIIFAGKFFWFLLGSAGFYAGLTVINALTNEITRLNDLYSIFLFSGILLVFYPAVFGIQNDQDARTIEILFGIPNYRYKVWLVRLILIFAISFIIVLGYAALSSVLVTRFRIFGMTAHVMAPVLLLGMMAFMLSTQIRNGNGTAVVMIIFGIFFLILSDSLYRSQWNVFLNPYDLPRDMSETVWRLIIIKNRIILAVGTVLFLLAGLYNLQKREKFM